MSNQTGSKTQEKYGAVYRCPISGSSCINMAIDDGSRFFRYPNKSLYLNLSIIYLISQGFLLFQQRLYTLCHIRTCDVTLSCIFILTPLFFKS